MNTPFQKKGASESEILLSHVEQLSKIGTWELDLLNNNLHWSAGVFKMLGYEPNEFKVSYEDGTNVLHPEDRERALKHAESAIVNGSEYNIQKRLIGKNNRVIHVVSKASIIYENNRPVKLIGVFQDISDFVATNQKLKVESEFNRKLIERLPSTFYMLNKKGKYLKWNRHLEINSGYSSEEIAQMTPAEFFDGEDAKRIEKHIQMAFDTGYTEVEAYLKTKSGKQRPYLYTAARMNYHGEECIFGIGYDLSEVKSVQADLQRVLDFSMDIICSIDKEGNFVKMSAASKEVLGYEPNEMIGKSFNEFINPLFLEESDQRLKKLKSGSRVSNFSNQYIHKNGSKVPLIWSAYWDEELQLIHCIAKDATEIVGYQEKLRKSNERYEMVTQATNDAIWDYDVVNNELYWAQGFQSLFGFDLDQLQPSFDFLVGNIHPEDREQVLDKIQKYMQPNSKYSIWEEEYRFKKANGRYAYVIDKAIFIRNKKGEVQRALGAMSDISHQKEYEKSLKLLNAELEQNVKQLAISNAELEQFAYVASHDLQEPLRMVTGFMSMLQEKYKHQLDDKANKYIHYATEGAQRMRKIILDLLDFSRLNDQSEELSKVDLNLIIEDIKLLHKKQIEEKKAKIKYKNLPTLLTYQSSIMRLFQNLISNALKYSKKEEKPIIQIKAEDIGSAWKFSVSDNGIGISEEFHDKIFVIFQRLHGRTQYSGTGIGLAVVKKIVENLGGKIWLESEENVGSTFYFTIRKAELID